MPVPSAPRADVGIGPYKRTTCVPSVGGDALIAPRGMSPERSEKTDTVVPSASGPMWASAPTQITNFCLKKGCLRNRRGFLLFFLAMGQGEGYNGSIVELTMDN